MVFADFLSFRLIVVSTSTLLVMFRLFRVFLFELSALFVSRARLCVRTSYIRRSNPNEKSNLEYFYGKSVNKSNGKTIGNDRIRCDLQTQR